MMLSLVAVAILAAIVITLAWLWRNPRCSRCGARNWDRYAVQPLLLCRKCATRMDPRRRKAG